MPGQQLSIEGAPATGNANVSTGGTFNTNGVVMLTAGPSNSATLNVGGGDVNNGGTFRIDFNADGSVIVTNGGVFNNLAGAIFDVQSDVSVTSFGAFDNDGTYHANRGITTMNTDFSQGATGTYAVSIGGLTPGTEYGQTNSNGAVTLNGGLQIIIDPRYTPVLGDTIQIITGSSVSGGFTNVIGADLGLGLVMKIIITPTAVELLVDGC